MSPKKKKSATQLNTQKAMHLVLNCYDCDLKKITDMKVTYNLLIKIPSLIGAKIMSFPYVVDAPGCPGLTAVVFLDASAITVHTFTDRKFVGVDVYFAKKFDSKKVIKEVKMSYAPKKTKHLILER